MKTWIKIIGGSNYGYPYQVIGNPQFKTSVSLNLLQSGGISTGTAATVSINVTEA